MHTNRTDSTLGLTEQTFVMTNNKQERHLFH